MRTKIAVFASAILLSVAAFGQNDANTVTVVATRSLDVPIEQVGYSVQVKSAIDATLSQVLQEVQSVGITANDLSGVSTTAPVLQIPIPGIVLLPDTPQLIWSFSLTSRFSQFQQTLAQLRALSTPNADKKSNFTISFSIANASASQASIDEAANGALPDLIAEARARAKRLADAAGLTVGVILSLSDQRSIVSSGVSGMSAADILRLTTCPGGFTSPKLAVSISVRFALLRYN
jgi:uncharacterized protein YggE